MLYNNTEYLSFHLKTKHRIFTQFHSTFSETISAFFRDLCYQDIDFVVLMGMFSIMTYSQKKKGACLIAALMYSRICALEFFFFAISCF